MDMSPFLVNESKSVSFLIHLQCFFKHGKSYLDFLKLLATLSHDVFKKFNESLKSNLPIRNDKYLSALIGITFNDLAPNSYALSIIKCES